MYSHDCHMFMQRLLPLAIRGFVPNMVYEAITKLCMFFRVLCSKTLHMEELYNMKHNISQTICKLEKIFPPSFFDSMEHLIIHLADEAILGGLVQYRWMYQYESIRNTFSIISKYRKLGIIKRRIRNKARVTMDSTDGSAKHLEPLANGPSQDARSYNDYFVNGYNFHTQEYGKGRETNNYRLCMRGEMYNGEESDYYGLLDEILEIDYYGIGRSTAVLFKCTWFDNIHVTKETKDIWAVVKKKPRGVYEVTEAETEVALDGNTEANGFFHLDEWFKLPNEVNVSERLTLASNRTNFEQISSNESQGSEAENQEDDTDEEEISSNESKYPPSGGRPSSLPEPSSLPRIPLTGGSVAGARSLPLSDLSGLPRSGFVLRARSSPLPNPSYLPHNIFTDGSVSGDRSSPDLSGLQHNPFLVGSTPRARSSPDPNGLPRIPLSGGLSRISVRTARPRFSGSSSMGAINTHMGLNDAIANTGVVQNVGNGIAYGYEMTGNNEELASDFFYNGPEHEHEPEHRHEFVHEPESPMVQMPHYLGTHGGSNDTDSNGSHRPFITRKGQVWETKYSSGDLKDILTQYWRDPNEEGRIHEDINDNFEILANYNPAEIHRDVWRRLCRKELTGEDPSFIDLYYKTHLIVELKKIYFGGDKEAPMAFVNETSRRKISSKEVPNMDEKNMLILRLPRP
uniref:DUF4218 domain-containing protein n=1 Tax=Lactuca sativa TaxID=4236 RepID=A0A9R1WLK0_LACSA|nr:hypothetical protein LSAT_V11C100010710 [Lactuca sativa]